MRNRMRRKTSQSSGTVVLAGLVNTRLALRGENKGDRYLATLRKDGYISFGGEVYSAFAKHRYLAYRAKYSVDSALARVSADLGHGEQRGPWLRQVYLRGVARKPTKRRAAPRARSTSRATLQAA